MVGRIYKEKGKFYCVIGTKKFPIVLDSKNKLRHGDLVELDSFPEKTSSKILSSEIKVKKSIKHWIPNITSHSPLNDRLKHRVIDLRNPKNRFIFLIKSEVLKFFRNFFNDSNFIEVNTPTIIGDISEGNVKRFEIDFYGKKAFLAMTRLLYLRLLICADWEKVYEIGPVFVAGNHNTPHHVSEFLTLDWAIADDSFELKQHMRFIDSLFKNLLFHLRNFTEFLGGEFNSSKQWTQLIIPTSPSIITYNDLIAVYLKEFPNDERITKQRHLPLKVIKYATKKLGNYFWVLDFPLDFKQFYCATDENKKIVISGELWWNRIKVASISFSESNIKETKKRLKLLKLNKNYFKTYLKAINFASSEAVLGSVYIERLLMVLLGLKNIREVIMFPRSRRQAVLEP